jgi:hypothetical protein
MPLRLAAHLYQLGEGFWPFLKDVLLLAIHGEIISRSKIELAILAEHGQVFSV